MVKSVLSSDEVLSDRLDSKDHLERGLLKQGPYPMSFPLDFS
jgi:hypothetical protein